jgi:hypothetical protein
VGSVEKLFGLRVGIRTPGRVDGDAEILLEVERNCCCPDLKLAVATSNC